MVDFRFGDYSDILFAAPIVFVLLCAIMFSILGIVLKITKE